MSIAKYMCLLDLAIRTNLLNQIKIEYTSLKIKVKLLFILTF